MEQFLITISMDDSGCKIILLFHIGFKIHPLSATLLYASQIFTMRPGSIIGMEKKCRKSYGLVIYLFHSFITFF